MLSDCFRSLEETISRQVEEHVRQLHDPLAASWVKEREGLQRLVQERCDALDCGVVEATRGIADITAAVVGLAEKLEVQQSALAKTQADSDGTHKELLAFRAECQASRQELISSILTEVRAEIRREVSSQLIECRRDGEEHSSVARTASSGAIPTRQDSGFKESPPSPPQGKSCVIALSQAKAAGFSSSGLMCPPFPSQLPPPQDAAVASALPPRVRGTSANSIDELHLPSTGGFVVDDASSTCSPTRRPEAKVVVTEQTNHESDVPPFEIVRDDGGGGTGGSVGDVGRRPTSERPQVKSSSNAVERSLGSRWGDSSILYLLLFFFLLVVAGVMAAVYVFPFITIALLGVISLWLLYLAGEEPLIQLILSKATKGGACNSKLLLLARGLRTVQRLRSSHEKEHMVQAILYTLCLCVFLLNPNLGLLFSLFENFQPSVAMMIILLVIASTTYLAHAMVQLQHERALGSKRIRSLESMPGGSSAVQAMMKEIQECLQVRGRHYRRSHQRIEDLFSRIDSMSLNELIERMHNDCLLEKLFDYFKDTNERNARSELISLLCKDRVHDLSVLSKSALLRTIMALRLSSFAGAEAAAESLLLSVEGDDLSELKSMQDGVGNIHSMHKLLFQDVTDQDLQKRVIRHFLAEGAAQVAHRALLSSAHFVELLRQSAKADCLPEELRFVQNKADGPSYSGECGHSWLKIITDIDDTMECSGGKWPAGIDKRYARHQPYPGVTAFYRELQGGGGPGQLVALSARPHLFGEVMETRVFKRFSKLIEKHGLHTMPALLCGSLDAGGSYLLSGGGEKGLQALMRKKCDTFDEYMSLYPEFRIVFIGDNGQADYAAGQRLCRDYPSMVEQVFIHEVQPREKTWGYEADTKAPIVFFEDYVMAAVSAAVRPSPLLPKEGLRRVVVAAVEDFKAITQWPTDGARDAEAHRLNRSIATAREVMRIFGVEDDVEFIPVDGSIAQVIFVERIQNMLPEGSFCDLARGLRRSTTVVDRSCRIPMKLTEVGVQTDAENTSVTSMSLALPKSGDEGAVEPPGGSKSKSIFDLARGIVGVGTTAQVTSSPQRLPEPTESMQPCEFVLEQLEEGPSEEQGLRSGVAPPDVGSSAGNGVVAGPPSSKPPATVTFSTTATSVSSRSLFGRIGFKSSASIPMSPERPPKMPPPDAIPSIAISATTADARAEGQPYIGEQTDRTKARPGIVGTTQEANATSSLGSSSGPVSSPQQAPTQPPAEPKSLGASGRTDAVTGAPSSTRSKLFGRFAIGSSAPSSISRATASEDVAGCAQPGLPSFSSVQDLAALKRAGNSCISMAETCFESTCGDDSAQVCQKQGSDEIDEEANTHSPKATEDANLTLQELLRERDVELENLRNRLVALEAAAAGIVAGGAIAPSKADLGVVADAAKLVTQATLDMEVPTFACVDVPSDGSCTVGNVNAQACSVEQFTSNLEELHVVEADGDASRGFIPAPQLRVHLDVGAELPTESCGQVDRTTTKGVDSDLHPRASQRCSTITGARDRPRSAPPQECMVAQEDDTCQRGRGGSKPGFFSRRSLPVTPFSLPATILPGPIAVLGAETDGATGGQLVSPLNPDEIPRPEKQNANDEVIA